VKQKPKLTKTTNVHRSKRLQKLLDAPKTFSLLTGLTPGQFKLLVEQVEPLFWEDDAARRAKRVKRLRRTGAGKQLELSVAEMTFMLLLYYRTYITHVFLGFLMDVDDGNVCRYFARLEPVLARIFKIPERRMDMTQEEVWELIVDATEQRSNRSKGSGYSGKKKGHTLKTQFIVGRDRRIKAVSKIVPGQHSDKKLYDRTQAYVKQGSIANCNKANPPPRLADLGYVGVPGAVLPIKHKPHRKSEDKKHLTKEQKRWNRLLSSNRVIVEHGFSFSGVKKFMILRGQYRNPVHRYSVTIKNIAGLHNFILDNPSG
jgi:hypothetical protein